MRFGIFIFCLILINCSKKQCGELSFNKSTKTTYSNNDLFTGDCKSLFFNGKLKSEQSYRDGKDHGNWVFYFINGTIQVEGKFDNGLRIGDWKYYHENGMLWKHHYYSDIGQKTGSWKEFDDLGNLIKEEASKQ